MITNAERPSTTSDGTPKTHRYRAHLSSFYRFFSEVGEKKLLYRHTAFLSPQRGSRENPVVERPYRARVGYLPNSDMTMMRGA
jgi:hypothetical protein